MLYGSLWCLRGLGIARAGRIPLLTGRVCGATAPSSSGRRDIRAGVDRAGRSHLPVRLGREVCALPQTRGAVSPSILLVSTGVGGSPASPGREAPSVH